MSSITSAKLLGALRKQLIEAGIPEDEARVIVREASIRLLETEGICVGGVSE